LHSYTYLQAGIDLFGLTSAWIRLATAIRGKISRPFLILLNRHEPRLLAVYCIVGPKPRESAMTSTPHRSHHQARSISLILIAVISLTACSPLAFSAKATPTPTATAIPPATATATWTSTPTAPPSATPKPSLTPTPNPTGTAEAQRRATVVAAMVNIGPEMDKVGMKAIDGHIVMIDPTAHKLTVTTYNESRYVLLGVPDQKDFVVHTEVTWNSTSGLAGCGILFRADEDMQNGGHFDFALMRLEFKPMWDIEYAKFGRWQQTLNGKPTPSDSIQDEPLSTNKMTLVVKGNEFTPYVNGEKLLTVKSDKQPEGQLAFHAWQESGESSCEFSNSWLWAPGPGNYAEPPVIG
jgi:hypothetical protein